MKKLDPRQQRFVTEYLVDLCGGQAAIRAGYSGKTAVSQACRLLTNVNIQDAIQTARKRVEDKLEVNRYKVLERLYAITQATIDQVVEHGANGVFPKDFKSIPGPAKAAISEMTFSCDKEGNSTVRLKMHNPISAAQTLANMQGWNMDGEVRPQYSRTINILNTNVDLAKLNYHQLAELKQLVASGHAGN